MLLWCYCLVTMTTVASCARNVNDLHPTVLRNPPPFPSSTRLLLWCYCLITMTTVASCARSVNDLHPTVLRNPPPFPSPTFRCDVKSYARVTSSFSLLNPLSYREKRCNSTSKIWTDLENKWEENKTPALCIVLQLPSKIRLIRKPNI
jgi:hypothetical protein